MDKNYADGPEYPQRMDNNDALGHFKQRFYLKEGTVYMCGNSLGPCCKGAEEALREALRAWRSEGVGIWSVRDSQYYLLPERIARLMAPLLNARPDELAVSGCTTGNIHQAIATLYAPTRARYKILVDELNFPTDRYAVDSQVRLRGLAPEDAVKVVRSRDGRFLREEDIIAAMTEDVAMVFLPAVLYRTAQLLDVAAISRAARERGILVGWDLCHAIGAVEIDFAAVDVDFAVWCTYKYLNGGPGSTAGIYLNRRHFGRAPGLAGWYGNRPDTRFLLRQEFDHSQDAGGLQLGTPGVLSLAPLEGALQVFREAGMANVRRKSLHITGYLMFLIETRLRKYGFTVGNPREDARRGGHVCAEHCDAFRLSAALRARGVRGDFREPDVLRLTPTALYTSYTDVYNMVEILQDIMETESYKAISNKRGYVV